MRSGPRDRGLWVTLAVLATLLLVLAVLQYRWIGEIGRAQAERRQVLIERSAWRFANSFDRELANVLMSFRVGTVGGSPAGLRAALVERLAEWQRREDAPLVSAALVATPSPSGGFRLESCAAGETSFHEIAWAGDLLPLRERLSSAPQARDAPLLRPALLLDSPLALVFPLLDEARRSPPEAPGEESTGPWGRFHFAGVGLLLLDADYVREHLLTQLAETHFGPLAESDFVVGVVRASDRTVLFTSDPAADLATRASGDVERHLPGRPVWPGGERPEAGRSPRFGRRPPGGPPPGEPRRPPDDSPWLLVARHRAGSLEDTVAAIRRRNLAVGLGLLGLLGLTGAILATGAERARALARQQMKFVAGVTHELNTPLAAIRSAGQNLADGIVKDAGQVRRYGGLIEKEGARLTGLVAQVLDFAGIEGGRRPYAFEPVSVARVIDDVLRDHRLVLEQVGMTVEREVAPDLPPVRADADALRRTLSNLVANASKFASSGHWLGIRAATRPDGRAVVVRVEDRGPGIAPDERERVFEPFYRGPAAMRNETPGNGLGLSLVRHVVAAHGGSVRIEGLDGGGAAVTVEIPVAPRAERRP